MRDRMIELRDDARTRYWSLRGGHERCPEAELWLLLVYVIERILASGLC